MIVNAFRPRDFVIAWVSRIVRSTLPSSFPEIRFVRLSQGPLAGRHMLAKAMLSDPECRSTPVSVQLSTHTTPFV